MEKSRGHQRRIVCEFRLPAYAHAVSRRAACSSSDFSGYLAAGNVSNMISRAESKLSTAKAWMGGDWTDALLVLTLRMDLRLCLRQRCTLAMGTYR